MVLGPLLVVMVVSLVMAGVAFRVADDRVMDDYYKEGRMINKRFAEEQNALDLGVKGTLRFDFATAEVLAELDAAVMPAELVLTFSHPSAAAQDLILILRRTGDRRYRADLPQLFEGRWYLIVSAVADTDVTWRVTTEVDFEKNHTAHFAAHL